VNIPNNVNDNENTATDMAPPLPTPAQLRYHTSEIVALVHFNVETFIPKQWCDSTNWAQASQLKTFAPTNLDMNNWVTSIKNLGAKIAVLTAKHGCGHLLWPTKSKLPNGQPYNYGVGQAGSTIQQDIVQQFSSTMRSNNLGYGFYYSLSTNFYLNADEYAVKNPSTLIPGQINVTQAQFQQIIYAQIQELWANYGDLAEIWFDGGYPNDWTEVTTLLQQYQPNAAEFLGPVLNTLRWVGTESGTPEGPLWSTDQYCYTGKGQSDGARWCPATCDTTLQLYDQWFWSSGTPIRSLPELIQVYHSTVGQNGVLELDFAIAQNGQVDPTHAQRYLEFGNWIKNCYGTPVASTSGNGTSFTITLNALVDRVVLQENQQYGQRVRNYTVSMMVQEGGQFIGFSAGTSIGNKKN